MLKKTKTMRKKIIAGMLLMMLLFSVIPSAVQAEEKGAVVLYTNDIHCTIGGYAKLAAYEAQLVSEGYEVVMVDAGDAIQGEIIGGQTKGSAIVDLMNEVGYDYAVPGNHEFDYGMDNFLELASAENSQFEYLSANFVDLRTNKTLFKPYDIVELNGEKVAFVGISTPETYTKSTPAYFQDENGNIIYGFSQSAFYETIQGAVDAAREEGANRVIAVGHLGISGTTEGWKSIDVIANTTGIDVFIDAHSHEVFDGTMYDNKDGESVLLTSTGSRFANFGQLNLMEDGVEEVQLIKPENVDVNSSQAVKTAYERVQQKIDDYNADIQYLYEKIGTAEVTLAINNPDSGDRMIRNHETNMGNFVADAYRVITGADISLANGGGIRAEVLAGDISRKALMDVNPWNNQMCVVSATGQQILDALEHGASKNPEESGGFLQTSGLTYEIHSYIDSPVVLDENGSFVKVDPSKERRVTNVKVNGIAIDPDKKYTVAATVYLLKQGGDGYTMFEDADIVKQAGLPVDSEMLIQYLTQNLGGVVTAKQYGNYKGDGRIAIYSSKEEVPVKNPIKNEENKEKQSVTKLEGGAPQTGDSSKIIFWMLLAMSSGGIVAGSIIKARKKRVTTSF